MVACHVYAPPLAGQPHVEVGVANLPIALALAAALLASGKTIHVKRKEVCAIAGRQCLVPKGKHG